MPNKRFPPDVERAIINAREADWNVSIRNEKLVIGAPDGVAITVGMAPSDESMKKFRRDCKAYNLLVGPATTPQEREKVVRAAEKAGEEEAKRLNAQRKEEAARERSRRQEIEAARKKANIAIQHGMTTTEEGPVSKPTAPRTDLALPAFDPKLLGTRDNSRFLLEDKTYYCVECWQHGERATYKAPQGLAAHRGVKHGLYPGAHPVAPPVAPPVSQETDRVQLPADVDTAMEMLRSALAEALGGGDSKLLEAKEAELEVLRTKLAEKEKALDAAIQQADKDRATSDKRFLEARTEADRRMKEIEAEGGAKSQAEANLLTEQFMKLLLDIQKILENSTPVQAVGKIDETVRKFLS